MVIVEHARGLRAQSSAITRREELENVEEEVDEIEIELDCRDDVVVHAPAECSAQRTVSDASGLGGMATSQQACDGARLQK